MQALAEMSRNNPIDRLKICLTVLQSQTETEQDEVQKQDILEEVRDWCEEVDIAVDFLKIGGLSVLTSVYHDQSAEIRWRCLDLIATVVQNNPNCQMVALNKDGFVSDLLELLDNDPDGLVQTKALYALSCLCRDFPEGQTVFASQGGFSILMRAMQCDVEKLKIKAAFMMSSLCQTQPAFKDTLCDMGMVDQLVGLLGNEHENCHEHLMSALLMLVTEHDRVTRECQRPELNLHTLLQERIALLQGRDENREECEYAMEILQQCFPENHNSQVSDVCR